MPELELMAAAINATVSGTIFIGICVMVVSFWIF
jgi:hypothetical protein